jgi:hypothetical protein
MRAQGSGDVLKLSLVLSSECNLLVNKALPEPCRALHERYCRPDETRQDEGERIYSLAGTYAGLHRLACSCSFFIIVHLALPSMRAAAPRASDGACVYTAPRAPGLRHHGATNT